MKSLLIYLLQLIIASGILYGYYHLFLRNKKFHQYNRYYLLSATIIAVIIPFLQIPFYFTKSEADSSPILKTLKTIYYLGPEDTIIVNAFTSHSFFSLNILPYFLYILVAAVLLTRIFMSLLKIKRIIRTNKSQELSGIRFISTTEPGTPFSFFRWLFWNKNIELQSAKGQQIFRHEIFHIQQKHSWDVLFIELVNMFLWVNPFFHIIKTEIKAIHEFLADEFATKEDNKWEYAELLLTRALQTKQQLVNPFFHNQIKRRIAMITNSQKTSHRYLRKLLALPLVTFAVILVAFTYKNKTAITQQDLIEPLKILPDARPELPDAGVLSGGKRFITITDTHVRRPNLNPLNVSDTSFKAYFRSNSIIVYDMFMKDTADDKLRFTPSTTTTFTSIKFYKDTSKPLDNILIVIDGKEHPDIKSSTDINGMDPNDISSMNVLKGASAISKYGSKGKYGVIEIFTKKERDKFVAKAPTIKAANEATKTTDTTLSTKDYNNLTNWNYDDPEFRIWRQKAIAEIKTIARNEQKTVYIYKGRTYIFANDEATNFTEMDGINHPLMLNGNFVSNVDKMNSLVKRQDIKKIGFISKEDALRLYNIDDYITTVTSW